MSLIILFKSPNFDQINLLRVKIAAHQKSGQTTANLPTRARWSQRKLDAA
jgi:hypothetical protein